MPRPKKDVVKVTYTLDKEVIEMIEKYHDETDIPKSKIIEQSVKAHIGKKVAKQKEEQETK